ncbi:group 1 truncated hemoglobin [Marinobacter panjinensis]|uniref:Group 1 truncated hemoglobin n=1 Tax=Marinobacter panjinensis TaxID=2576384 RepID=A0A4U6R5D8_9GAMM|nr:group 1 truncated hemoglobin [Marinobacter panjinensis]MCR8914208.1 group 1 truncated hemoglobin [Marinobacter panjinensis]TKV68940.1 group 1 truncated hemoglobin [Marinobacter panjinensis]
MRYSAIAVALVTMLALAGCQSMAETTDPSETLYQKLGERSGIANIVEDLLYLIVEDDRINEQFRGVDVRQFHTNLTDQLCELSGGPCTYSGRKMRESHSDMNVTDTQFNALAENLILAMEQNNIATGAQNRLIKKLVPLYPQIRNL